MIKILNIFQLLEGFKVFLEVVNMIYKGVQQGLQHFRSKRKTKSNKQGRLSAMAPEGNKHKKE